MFLRVLLEYVRHRDPVSRDATLVFTAFAMLFVLELARRLTGAEPPALLTRIATFLLLAQPFLTLRLVARVRHVSPWLLAAAFAAFVATAVPTLVLPPPLPLALTLTLVATFVLTETAAAVLLGREARRRTGSARARMTIAALATAAFALAILAAGAGAASAQQSELVTWLTRVLSLLAAVGYLIAFVPIGWLIRIWQGGAAYDYVQRLLRTPADETVDRIWSRFARTALEISGWDAAVVAVGDDGPSATIAAAAGVPTALDSGPSRAELGLLTSGPAFVRRYTPRADAPWLASVANAVEARYYAVLPLRPLRETRETALVLVGRRLSLFSADDRSLIQALGIQTLLLAERRGILGDQERLSARLAETVEALRAANKAKDDFVASMSHELRTPLNAIIGFTELMLGEQRRDGQTAVPIEWIEHVHRSGEHLLGLINDVLDLSKIAAGRLELRREHFEISSAVGETLDGLRPLAERKRLHVASQVGQGPLFADRARFRQVLYNLLSNAIKFTPEGGSIVIDATRDGDELSLSVADSGIGIAEEDQARIFEEFRQVGGADWREPGTGLGLALTRRLVEAHGGRIGVESIPGKGSTFTVVFPGQPDTAAVPETGVTARPPTASERQPESRGTDVLVIEDDVSAVRLLRAYLESEGYAVRAASGGTAGLEEARRRRPSAIVLDILLPDVDGWDVLRQVKADQSLRDVPVVIVTVVDERDVGLALGAVDYFLKPVDRQALLGCMSRLTLTRKVRDREVRVLVADDDAATRDMLEATLTKEGFRVLLASGGREAVDLARGQSVDMVICDLLMPDLDGFGVVAALKSDPATHDIPVVVLTAHDLTSDEKAELNGQILGVVRKGTDAREGLLRWLATAAGSDSPKTPSLTPTNTDTTT